MPPWLSWLPYLSFFYYGYEALAVNELDGLFLSGNVYGDVGVSNVCGSLSQCCVLVTLHEPRWHTCRGEVGCGLGDEYPSWHVLKRRS